MEIAGLIYIKGLGELQRNGLRGDAGKSRAGQRWERGVTVELRSPHSGRRGNRNGILETDDIAESTRGRRIPAERKSSNGGGQAPLRRNVHLEGENTRPNVHKRSSYRRDKFIHTRGSPGRNGGGAAMPERRQS